MPSDRELDVVIVHYHSAPAVREAVAALRDDARRCGLLLHLIVADNGSTPEERALLEKTVGDRVLDTGRNAGYAGAINCAFPLTRSDFVIVMNEDVIVLPGCLRTLHAALSSGAAVAGPQFYWNRQRTFVLPCTEERTRRNELLKVSAQRSVRRLECARQAWRKHARRHWLAREPLPTTSLSGALLAFRHDTWTAVGPFDDGFALYFEENDWLIRVKQAGLTSVYLPEATAIHLHNPSVGQSQERQQWHARSFQRFGNRYYGERFMQRLTLVSSERRVLPAWDAAQSVQLPTDFMGSLWLEVTPSPLGFPAAAARLTSNEVDVRSLLDDLSFVNAPLYVQLVDDERRELVRYAPLRGAATAVTSP